MSPDTQFLLTALALGIFVPLIGAVLALLLAHWLFPYDPIVDVGAPFDWENDND